MPHGPMPHGASNPNLPNGPPNTNHPIIADALQVAYTADYRGDFNLDEAAYYIANQWNNMKINDVPNRNY